ncbi:MAG: dihydroorotate dehydrogenase [Thermovirga sp.]
METPVIVASGVWPMDPSLWPMGSMDGVGAICSKGITHEPKTGNTGNRLRETPSGLLNSIGLQNDGVQSFVSKGLPALASSGKPVIANISFDSIEELDSILQMLHPVREMIGAVEMNVSCPNVSKGGMVWGVDPIGLESAVTTARSAWEGPLWVKLSPQAPSIAEAARICESSGAQAVVVGNTWLGMAIDNEREKPFFERIFAGLSGPAIFPLSLRLVWEAAGSVNIPVVGCGGIGGPDEALSMILAGAAAVALGTGLFLDSFLAASVCRKISDHMGSRGIRGIGELTGRARGFRENGRQYDGENE